MRTRAPWLLVGPFLLGARPTKASLVGGAVVAIAGLLVRGWAAGCLDKGGALAVDGPYAFTRNPLYLGSFVIGVGVAAAGGHWIWPAVFVAGFTLLYVPTMRHESAELLARYGPAYRDYATRVPSFIPHMAARRPLRRVDGSFTWSRYLRYREWEAALGVAAALGVLALKL